VHDELLSRGCRKHAKYYGLNPTHRLLRETPSAAGYTEAGDRAARSSVLAFGERGPDAGISAWEQAPITAWRCSIRGSCRPAAGTSSA